MSQIIILIALFGATDDFTFSGTRLQLSNYPILVRLRWLIIGIALGCIIIQYRLPSDSPWTWALLIIFLITMAKKRVPKMEKSSVAAKEVISPNA